MCKKLRLLQAKLFVMFHFVMLIRPKFSGVLSWRAKFGGANANLMAKKNNGTTKNKRSLNSAEMPSANGTIAIFKVFFLLSELQFVIMYNG